MRHWTHAIVGLLLLPYALKAQTHTVAITVDDLPFASGYGGPLNPHDATGAIQTNKEILDAFSRHHIPATGFVIEEHAEQIGTAASTKIFKRWLRPGFDLGNHLYSHADANTDTVEQIEREVLRGQTMITPLLQIVSRKPRFFRFPYNHTGDTKPKHDAIAAFLAAHGYRLAPCTIDGSDYEFNAAYVVALARHDKSSAVRLRTDYIAYTAKEIDWYNKLDKQVFGYEVPDIMLLHDSPLNADTVDAIIALFENRGYHFITLSEALESPAYATPETYITKYGPMWGYRWAKELHVKVNGRDEPNPPAWIDQYAKQTQPQRN